MYTHMCIYIYIYILGQAIVRSSVARASGRELVQPTAWSLSPRSAPQLPAEARVCGTSATTQDVALSPRETNFRSFFRGFFP